MAYKFQLGAAVLSGSLTQEGDVTGEGNLTLANSSNIGCAADTNLITLANQSVAFANDVDVNIAKAGGLQIGGVAVTATAAELNVLDELAQGSILLGDGSGAPAITDIKTSGQILVGNGTTAASVAVSGDAALAANGALTIANDAVNNDKLANIARGSVKVGGASNAPTDLDAKTSGQILVGNGTDIVSVAISGDATLAANGALTIANDAIENAMIADNAVQQAQLADDAVGADELAANAVVNASVASNAAIAASKIDFNVDLGGNITFGDQTDDTVTFGGGVTVTGDLTVNGTTTSVNSTTINITSSFTFEGPADDHETTLGVVDPTADATIKLPAMSAGTYFLPVLSAASTTAITATPEELNVLDGLAQGSILLGDGSGAAAITDIKTAGQILVGNGTTATSVAVSGDATLSAAGVLTIAANAIEGSMLNDNAISGQGGFDPDTEELADTDELLLSDGGVLKKIDFSVLRDTINVGTAPALKSDGNTLSVGVNYMSNMDFDGEDTLTLPASSDMVPGMSIKVKAPSDCSAARFLTIATAAAAQKIDGVDSIRLESPHAAVELIYVATNNFKVF